MVVTAQKRYSNGLTLNANFTWSHALGIISTGQSYTLDNAGNPFNLYSDYGPQYFDRRFVVQCTGDVCPCLLARAIGCGQGAVASRVLGGWSISPIFSWGTGLPVNFATGSYAEQGQAWDGDLSASPIPIGSAGASSLGNSPHFGVTSNGTIGVNGDCGARRER